MQVKTTMSYHLTPVRMALTKKNPQATNAGEGVKRRKPSYSVDGDVNWYSLYGELYRGSLKN